MCCPFHVQYVYLRRESNHSISRARRDRLPVLHAKLRARQRNGKRVLERYFDMRGHSDSSDMLLGISRHVGTSHCQQMLASQLSSISNDIRFAHIHEDFQPASSKRDEGATGTKEAQRLIIIRVGDRHSRQRKKGGLRREKQPGDLNNTAPSSFSNARRESRASRRAQSPKCQ